MFASFNKYVKEPNIVFQIPNNLNAEVELKLNDLEQSFKDNILKSVDINGFQLIKRRNTCEQ
jgi:hypothetical protein